MTLTQNDIGALAYLGRRIREETIGASKWDEPGIAAGVRRMIDRGFGFDEILDQVTAHARDRSARNPGVLGHPMAVPPAEPRTPRGPRVTEACPDHGVNRTRCGCDPRAPRKPVVDSTAPDVQDALTKAREAVAAARGQA